MQNGLYETGAFIEPNYTTYIDNLNNNMTILVSPCPRFSEHFSAESWRIHTGCSSSAFRRSGIETVCMKHEQAGTLTRKFAV